MSETTNLNLFKHDNPSSNTNAFNVETALNENWDKIDEFAEETIEARGTFNTLDLRLNDMQEKIDDNTNTLRYYLMPTDNSSTNGAAGDCHILFTENNKVIMIDTGYTPSYSKIKAKMQELEITKVDYLIISHYHGDHVDNLSSLMQDFDFSECIAYLPRYTTHTDASPRYTTVNTLLANNTIINPTNGDTVDIDNIEIEFFNCSQADIDYYNANSTDYNDQSMCCYVTHKNIRLMFTGDIAVKAQQRILESGFLKHIDLYKIEHHGANAFLDSDFIRNIDAKYAVVSNNEKTAQMSIASQTDGSLKLNTMSYLAKNDCEVYATCYNEDIGFISDGYTIQLITNSFLMQYNGIDRFNYLNASVKSIDVYVDASYEGEYSNGTYDKPFKTIQEAIVCGIINNYKTVIHVANGTYDEANLLISNITSHVIILGQNKQNTLVKNIYVSNCPALCFKNLTFYDTKDNSIIIGGFSNVEFNECIINGQSAESTHRGIGVYDSQIKLYNTEISNKGIAIALTGMTRVASENLTGSNNNYIFNTSSQEAIIQESGTSITYNNYMFYRLYGVFTGPKTNGNTAALSTMIAGGNAFNTIFYNNSIGKPVLFVGGVWKDFAGNNV